MHVMADIVRQAAEIIKAPYIVIDMVRYPRFCEYLPTYFASLSRHPGKMAFLYVSRMHDEY